MSSLTLDYSGGCWVLRLAVFLKLYIFLIFDILKLYYCYLNNIISLTAQLMTRKGSYPQFISFKMDLNGSGDCCNIKYQISNNGGGVEVGGEGGIEGAEV